MNEIVKNHLLATLREQKAKKRAITKSLGYKTPHSTQGEYLRAEYTLTANYITELEIELGKLVG